MTDETQTRTLTQTGNPLTLVQALMQAAPSWIADNEQQQKFLDRFWADLKISMIWRNSKA